MELAKNERYAVLVDKKYFDCVTPHFTEVEEYYSEVSKSIDVKSAQLVVVELSNPAMLIVGHKALS